MVAIFWLCSWDAHTVNNFMAFLEALPSQRANCENRIKELKYDYALDKMNQASFNGTEAKLMLMTVAYNFQCPFKQLIVVGNVWNRLKTIRLEILSIPAIVEQSNDKTKEL